MNVNKSHSAVLPKVTSRSVWVAFKFYMSNDFLFS